MHPPSRLARSAVLLARLSPVVASVSFALPALADFELIDAWFGQARPSVNAMVDTTGVSDSLIIRVIVVNRSSREMVLPASGNACGLSIKGPDGQRLRVDWPLRFDPPGLTAPRRTLRPDSTLEERIAVAISSTAADSVLAAEAPRKAWMEAHRTSARIPPMFIPVIAVREPTIDRPIVFWPTEAGHVLPGMYTVSAGLSRYGEESFGSTAITISTGTRSHR